MPEKITKSSPSSSSSALSAIVPKKAEKPLVSGGKAVKTQRPPEKLDIQLDFARVSQRLAGEHVLFSPVHYEPGYSYPLLVWLHGPGNNERQIMKMMPLISMRNFVGVSPRGMNVQAGIPETQDSPAPENLKENLARSAVPELVLRLNREQQRKTEYYDWPQSEEGITFAEQQVFDCISLAKEKCNISEKNIFLVGFDRGGTMGFRLAMQFPQYFAGVISLGGSFPTGNLPLNQWSAVRELPSMLAIGKESPVYCPARASEDLKLFHTAGLSVSVRQYDCAQEVSPQMLQDMNRWIMEHVCNSKS